MIDRIRDVQIKFENYKSLITRERRQSDNKNQISKTQINPSYSRF